MYHGQDMGDDICYDFYDSTDFECGNCYDLVYIVFTTLLIYCLSLFLPRILNILVNY